MNTTTLPAAGAAPATGEPTAPGSTPRRRLTRRTARRIAVVRDVLASIKDAGLILGFAALLLFHDQVAAFLSDLDLVQGGGVAVVDVQRSLARINRAVDSAMLPGAGAAGATAAPLGRKVLLAEQRLLRSEDAAFLDDWIVVVAPVADAAQGAAVVARLATLSVPAQLLQKNARLHVVARAESADAAQSVLNRVRPSYPRALPTTQASWCAAPPAAPGAVPVCRNA